MTDDKCDGVIYKRIGNEYFKRDYEDAINIQWFGLGNGDSSNTNKIKSVLSRIGSAKHELYFKKNATSNYLNNLQISSYSICCCICNGKTIDWLAKKPLTSSK